MNPSVQSVRLKDLGSDRIIGICMLFGFAAYMIIDQLHWWNTREDYSFGFLVPLFALYVMYDRWWLIQGYLTGRASGQTAPPVSEPPVRQKSWLTAGLESLALVGFLGGIGLFALGALLRSVTGPQNPASLAIATGFSGLFLGTVFLLSGKQVDGEAMPLKNRLALTGLFLFPALVWLISAPLVSVMETRIRVFLLTQVTIVVFNIFDILGFDIIREGNILILEKGKVQVEEACSGIYSLTACIFVGTFLAAVFLERFWKKVLMVFAAIGLAILTNLFRSLFLTSWSYAYGSGAINDHWSLPLIGSIGTVHDVMGFAVLGITSICLLLLLPIFNFKLEALVGVDDDDDEDDDDNEEDEDEDGDDDLPDAEVSQNDE